MREVVFKYFIIADTSWIMWKPNIEINVLKRFHTKRAKDKTSWLPWQRQNCSYLFVYLNFPGNDYIAPPYIGELKGRRPILREHWLQHMITMYRLLPWNVSLLIVKFSYMESIPMHKVYNDNIKTNDIIKIE
jgi:hypothetical protein